MGRKTGFEKLREAMLGKYTKKYIGILDTLDNEEFCLNYHKTMEYCLPKLQRTEFNNDTKEDLTT